MLMNQNKFKELNEQKRRSLEILLAQIASFDNKASIIVSILGIVFALSFTVIETVSTKVGDMKIYIFISFVLFLISIISFLICAVLVLKPRKREKTPEHKSLTYYIDLENMSEEEYSKLFELNDDGGTSFEQLNENAKICHKKHKLLMGSIVCMIPLVIFFLLTTILIIWF
jgi:putative Ca2+/H+ antiporter (TMEM165/GDT1 family)